MASYQISENLFLVQQQITKKVAPALAKPPPIHHILVLDCSGSMWGDLPHIREQLKRKLPKMLGEKDVISILWFSGRDQFGALLEAESVPTLTDLQQVNAAIDRWLKPVGLTGFLQPIKEAGNIVDKASKKLPNHAVSFMFLSDGADNCSHRPDILSTVQELAPKFSSATFVEYGYYADRPLLTRMAEKAGGALIFAEDFDRYAPVFEAVITKKLSGAPRVQVKITGDPIGGFAYALADGDLLTFAVEDGAVSVPEDLTELWYLSPSSVGSSPCDLKTAFENPFGAGLAHPACLTSPIGPAYAALSLFSQRMNSDVVLALLKLTGDIRFIDAFASCYGKQRYSEFVEAAKVAAFSTDQRLTQGYDPKRVPDEDAFTVLELLQILVGDDDNRVLLDHPAFKYNRIGRATVDANDVVTKDDRKKIEDLAERASKTKDPKELKTLGEELASLSKEESLKFVADPAPEGYSLSTLTYNEERANVSFLVQKRGTVDLSKRLVGDPALSCIPPVIPTYVYRNYAVIKDGIVNIDHLPVLLTETTCKRLEERGAPLALFTDADGKPVPAGARTYVKGKAELVLNLRVLPVINRRMVRMVSASQLFKLEYDLVRARADQKVYNSVFKQVFPKESEGFNDLYGEVASTWLKEQGITDFGGFAPRVVQAEATDFYMGKELKIKLKGLSSLPTLVDVNKRRASGKLTASAALMVPAIENLEVFYASDVYKEADDQNKMLRAWLGIELKKSQARVRRYLYEMAQIRFSIIVGQTWPTEFVSLDEDSMDITVDGTKISCQLVAREIEVKI